MRIQSIITFIILAIVSFCSTAQKLTLSTDSDSAAYYYRNGWRVIMDQGMYTLSEVYFRQAITHDPKFLLAQCQVARLSKSESERNAILDMVQKGKQQLPADERMLLDNFEELIILTNLRAAGDTTAQRKQAKKALQLSEKNLRKFSSLYPEEVYHNCEFIEVINYLYGPQAALDTLETILYDFIQKEAGNPIYNEMLVWTHLQQKNFAAALRQARALDRRTQNDGENIVNVGMIAYRNEDYKVANKAFGYIINDFSESPSRRLAQKYLLLSEEEVVKSTYPVDTVAVRSLIGKYSAFQEQSRDLFSALDAQRRKALLHAFYLNEIPESIEILTDLVNQPVGKHRIIAESKMDLADIYLLDKQPWESILLYAQVERMFKDEPLGYQAKLKSAKLSYFKGEFELAQGHLDILKLATSREIANDALNLSILIKNNTVFDSTDVVMQEYANVELMLFQNQKQEALTALDDMLAKYGRHSIADEIHYLKAQTYRELGEPAKAVEALNNIIESYNYDILADDALFLTAVILEEDLQDADKAMELYTEVLNKFPGSIFVSEARKRFRELRGDF